MIVENIRIGIVGLGQLAREVHLPNLAAMPGASVTVLADPSPEARSQAGTRFAGARLCQSIEELLESGLADAVLIASPTAEHARHAHLAIKAGVPFYLEKPIAAELADALTLCDSAAGAGVHAMMGFNYRFHPRVTGLQQSLRGITRCESVFTIAPRELPRWKRKRSTGGGVLLDLASHHFDLLTLLVRSKIAAVNARIWSEQTEDDCAEVGLEYHNGVRAACTFSFCRKENDVIALTTSDGRAIHDRYAPWTYPLWPLPGFLSFLAERQRSTWKEPSFRRSVAAWVESLRSGGTPPVPLLDGLESLRIVCAAEQSSAAGGQTIWIKRYSLGEEKNVRS